MCICTPNSSASFHKFCSNSRSSLLHRSLLLSAAAVASIIYENSLYASLRSCMSLFDHGYYVHHSLLESAFCVAYQKGE